MGRTKWVKQPPPITGRGRWERQPRPEHLNMATRLKAAPNRWAVIDERDTVAAARQFAQSIKNGTNLAFTPAGSFEATTRGAEIYARYIGG